MVSSAIQGLESSILYWNDEVAEKISNAVGVSHSDWYARKQKAYLEEIFSTVDDRLASGNQSTLRWVCNDYGFHLGTFDKCLSYIENYENYSQSNNEQLPDDLYELILNVVLAASRKCGEHYSVDSLILYIHYFEGMVNSVFCVEHGLDAVLKRIKDVLSSTVVSDIHPQFTDLLTAYVLLNVDSISAFEQALEKDPSLIIHTLLLAKRLQTHQGDEAAISVIRVGKELALKVDFDSYIENVEKNYIYTGLVSQSGLIKDLSVPNQVLSSLIHQERRVSHSLPIQFKEYARSGHEEISAYIPN